MNGFSFLKWHRQYFGLLVFIALLFFNSFSEEVCELNYTSSPENFNGKTIKVPDNVVSLTPNIKVGLGDSIVDIDPTTIPSILFLIDQSRSMEVSYAINGEINRPNDSLGSRYSVPAMLLDSIRNVMPQARIGVMPFVKNLYCCAADSAYFKTCKTANDTDEVRGYVPPLQLDSLYIGFDDREGIDILKSFLKLKIMWLKKTIEGITITDTCQTLKYDPSVKEKGGTNITNAFEAAKIALRETGSKPEYQFIIFLSDGLPNDSTSELGGVEYMNRYIKGDSVPTTFTVYFNRDGVAPPNLVTMTENIKTNNFSENNNTSNIWAIQTDHDKLMSLLMENVMTQLVTLIKKTTPISIDLNGSKSTQFDGNAFTFAKPHPLSGAQTPIEMAITYNVFSADSQCPDTTINLEFTVERNTPPVTLIPGIETNCWDRTITFNDDSTPLTIISNEVDTVTIQFTEEDSPFYHYTDVPIVLTVKSRPQEREVINLEPEDGSDDHIYSMKIPLSFTNGNSDDGEINVNRIDTLYAFFKNPDLPLDTLTKSIPIYSGQTISIDEGIYFDNNADGLVDSISFSLTGEDLNTFKDNIVESITLPSWRQFTINKTGLDGNNLHINVTQEMNEKITDIRNDDKCKIDSVQLTEDALLLPSTFMFIDSMAPVAIEANLIDSAKAGSRDELSVTFSEKINSITKNKPFLYITANGDTEYNASLEVINQSDNSALFSVENLEKVTSIKNGDSLWIANNQSTNITDPFSNNQSNSQNIRVPISVKIIPDGCAITSGAYHDKDADGLVDCITFVISGKKIDTYKDKIFDEISLPSWREFTVTERDINNNIITFNVNQGLSDRITSIESEDLFELTDTLILSDEIKLLPSEFAFEDSMAAVVLQAHYVDSMKLNSRDELTVTFSETVQNSFLNQPFYFIQKNSLIEFNAELQFISMSDKSALFSVENIMGVSNIAENDSLWINADLGENVVDKVNNNQSNPHNIRQPITTETVYEGIEIQSAVYYDLNADGQVDKLTIRVTGDRIENNLNEIISNIKLPEKRDFSIEDRSYADNVISLTLKENGPIETSVDNEDKLIISSEMLSDNITLNSGSVLIIDSIAPVIQYASAINFLRIVKKGKNCDTALVETNLEVEFSEDVLDITYGKPFIMYHDENDYSLEMKLNSLSEKSASFSVENTGNNSERIVDGDSIKIQWDPDNSVVDKNGIGQSNNKNIKQIIHVSDTFSTVILPADYSLKFKATVLGDKKGLKDSMMIVLEADPIDNFGDFDIISASLTIFDLTGNVIINDREMEFQREYCRAIYAWDGKSNRERKVGSGTYIAQITAYRGLTNTTDNSESASTLKNVFIKPVGVKK